MVTVAMPCPARQQPNIFLLLGLLVVQTIINKTDQLMMDDI